MKTVMIFGAGATRAAGANKSKQKTPPLDRDFFDISSKVNPALYREVSDCLHSLVGEYSETLKKSLETATSYLYLKAVDANKGSDYQKGFIDLLQLLNHVLAHTTNDLSLGPRSLLYRLLISEISKLESASDLTVITFNYDLLIERSIEEIASKSNDVKFYFPGCYRLGNVVTNSVPAMETFKSDGVNEEGIAILKLHGSMNWQSKHTTEIPAPSAMFNPVRTLHVIDSPSISPQLKWTNRKRIYHMKPIIVPPVSGKRNMMHNLLIPLWDKAARALQQADRVVIVGYSCPPLDLEARMLLSENLRLNTKKRLYVIDPSAETASKFIDICGVNHSTIYSSIKGWVTDAKLHT